MNQPSAGRTASLALSDRPIKIPSLNPAAVERRSAQFLAMAQRALTVRGEGGAASAAGGVAAEVTAPPSAQLHPRLPNRAQRRAGQAASLAELLKVPSPAECSYQTTRMAAPAAQVLAPLPVVNWQEYSAQDVAAGHRLTPSAVRTWAMLHELALKVARARRYRVRPDAVVYHLPAGLLAAALGIERRQLLRDRGQLEAAGLLDSGGQAQKVRGMGLYGGCLWAVQLKPGSEAAQIGAEEWHHEYRDFEGDIEAGRTVQALLAKMSQLHPDEAKKAYCTAVTEWAVSPSSVFNPLSVVGTFGDLRQIAYTLGSLEHTEHRAEMIGRIASELAATLGDQHSRRYYCALLWAAVKQGAGALGALAAALERVATDCQEWPELRNPGALLAARLRPAS